MRDHTLSKLERIWTERRRNVDDVAAQRGQESAAWQAARQSQRTIVSAITGGQRPIPWRAGARPVPEEGHPGGSGGASAGRPARDGHQIRCRVAYGPADGPCQARLLTSPLIGPLLILRAT
jgi:hypothetical protein